MTLAITRSRALAGGPDLQPVEITMVEFRDVTAWTPVAVQDPATMRWCSLFASLENEKAFAAERAAGKISTVQRRGDGLVWLLAKPVRASMAEQVRRGAR